MNHKLNILILLLLSGVAGSPVFAQFEDANTEVVYSTDGKGWVFGLNVGVYYPSKYTASYYSGNKENENNVDYVMSNYYWYQDIFHTLNANDSISVYGLPQDMHYKIAIQPGIYAQYSFNPELALIIQFNYMQLKAEDVIIFEVDPKEYLTEKDLRLYPIRGVEERVYADIGIKRSFVKNKKLSWFLIGGLNANSTKVKKSSFYVEEVEYSMINQYGNNSYIPNGNMQSYNVYQGGIGFGMHIGGGATLTFADRIFIEPGFTAHWLMVKLDRYDSMNPGIGAYLRFLF